MTDQWWKSAVVYQIYPRSFADSDGDGVGDLRGITGRLDYLATLGIDVIWLSPVYRSPMDDNGYDISDYQDVDPQFGTLADLDELLAEAHRRGIKLLMDLVVNHTSDEHPWFVESRSSTNNPRRDWYWWRPARTGMQAGTPGAEPTNWESAFSGSAWEYDEASGEYFLHLFSRKQPDLNWENPEVREAVYAMMRWWLDRGVDGFRMDVVNMISKAVTPGGGLLDGPVRPGHLFGDGGEQFMNGPRIHEYLAEMRREVFGGRTGEFLTVGEMPRTRVDQARLYTDPARGEVDMIFQFEHVTLDQGSSKWDVKPYPLTALKASLGRWQAGLAPVEGIETGWNSLYWNNHDQPRVVSRLGDDSPQYRALSAKLLGTVLHLHRGTPYVYQGEELGMTNAPFEAVEDFQDIESVNHYVDATAGGQDPDVVLASMRAMSRDNARTPMQWDASPNAGFTTGTPWLPANPNAELINAAAEINDPDSVFSYYQALIRLRHDEPTVVHGDFTMLLANDETIYAYTRAIEGTRLLVAANFSAGTVPLPAEGLEEWKGTELVLGNYPAPDDVLAGLRPWEARVLRARAG